MSVFFPWLSNWSFFDSSSAGSLGLNNISPERDGTEGKKNGAFSGFFGGSIGLFPKLMKQYMVWAHLDGQIMLIGPS